jgi:uncharacterized membrane-anchored protein YitT (DUF2179 family)
MPSHDTAPLQAAPHTLLEDIQAMVIGCLFTALGVVMLREARLLSGGTTGLAFIAHYLGGWRFGTVLFLINLPFYVFGYKALGPRFTIKTFCAIGLLSVFTELVPGLIGFTHLDPVFAAVMSGLAIGIGILILIRHGASLGGVGVMAIYLQKTRGWRAGTVQMAFDSLILATGLLVVEPHQVMLSVLGAAALNLVIGVNHRPDRYHGF